jgi:prepilin-type N-terminal cleavage/methylation domain-containing protein
VSRQGALEDERGFTLVEVMVTIILMLIVFGIASSTWFKVAESRRVDSATNQVAADLRQAHARATNPIGYITGR